MTFSLIKPRIDGGDGQGAYRANYSTPLLKVYRIMDVRAHRKKTPPSPI